MLLNFWLVPLVFFLYFIYITKKLMAFYRILEPLKWVLIINRSMCDNGLNKSRDRNLVSAEKSFVDQAPSWSHLIHLSLILCICLRNCMCFIVMKDKDTACLGAYYFDISMSKINIFLSKIRHQQQYLARSRMLS